VLSGVLSPFNSGVLITRLDPSLEPEYYAIADELRAGGIPCEVYLYDRRLKDQLDYGNRRGCTKVRWHDRVFHGRGCLTFIEQI